MQNVHALSHPTAIETQALWTESRTAGSALGKVSVYSATSIVAAFACSTLVGVLLGYLPARNAARLDPVVALSRE